MHKTRYCAETRPALPQSGVSATQQPVVVVGGANMDVIAQTGGAAVAGDSTPGAIACSPGGVGRNIAENLARLGVQTALISVVGDDAFGSALLQAAADCSIDTAGCMALAGHRTATYLAVHGAAGEMTMAVNDMGILAQLSPSLLQAQAQQLDTAACVVLDCNLEPQTIDWLLDRNTTAAVFVDAVSVVKCQKLVGRLHRIHTLKVNALEAQALTRLTVASVAQAEQAARDLCRQGVHRVVVSLGAEGAVWAQGADAGACAAHPMNVTNTTGAGDAMLAGLVFAHLHQWSLPHGLLWAMACAELTLASASANRKDLSAEQVQAHLATANGAAEFILPKPGTCP